MARMPAMEAALARFGGWWSERTPRERRMLAGLALFLGAVLVVYGIVKPIQAARADALARIHSYETLTARIRAAGTLAGQATPPLRQGPAARLANDAASAAGLVVTAEPSGAGARVTIRDGRYDAMLGWIAELDRTTDLRVRTIAIDRGSAPGMVHAVVELAR